MLYQYDSGWQFNQEYQNPEVLDEGIRISSLAVEIPQH
jgi:hypothetical protein